MVQNNTTITVINTYSQLSPLYQEKARVKMKNRQKESVCENDAEESKQIIEIKTHWPAY